MLLIGLAPGAHGTNRTGRMFTGDSSGNFLYRALFETGFAVTRPRGRGPTSEEIVSITNRAPVELHYRHGDG